MDCSLQSYYDSNVREIRRKTDTRSIAEAEAEDIFTITSDLDRKGLLECKVRFCATNGIAVQ